MQDGTYPPRNFATLGPLLLQPMFTGTLDRRPKAEIYNSQALIRCQTLYIEFASLQCPVFLINSRSLLFCAILIKPTVLQEYCGSLY